MGCDRYAAVGWCGGVTPSCAPLTWGSLECRRFAALLRLLLRVIGYGLWGAVCAAGQGEAGGFAEYGAGLDGAFDFQSYGARIWSYDAVDERRAYGACGFERRDEVAAAGASVFAVCRKADFHIVAHDVP